MNSVMTYNIKNDSPTPEKKDLWEYRLPKMVQLLNRHQPELLGLQEVTAEQLEGLKKACLDYHFIGSPRSDEKKSEFNPIAYAHKIFELIKTDTFWLSETPNEMRKADEWQADCYRIATWGILERKVDRRSFLVINTHFDHMSERARVESAKLLNQFIKEQTLSNIILMGDLNADTKEACYSILSENLYDVMPVSPYHVGPNKTCTGVDFKHDIQWDTMMQIDYIFFSSALNVLRTEVVTDKIGGQYPSDHFPVFCEFSG
ncbi:endonuclease/exonuclease/phosphatase family protein [Enterococcus ureasiticus]|uniref:Endonuclease/exonuclease/phosphatase domain-containing protein n=1 Tax=Enterococcus ureasiticus TaxID=903984 RepID=A0A1E5GA55_9ENTE|nr:endonuclease/exonuclease/phosphatase family protein [Enterococcus ureasiticus]OEG09573.1 hypothetical protein BCR21_14595 [Enterococcus ureasiticus]